MTQRQIDRAVARATGEDLHEIQRRGFGAVDDFDDDEPFALGKLVDWDAVELARNVAVVEPRRRAA
ncbi:MAG: hypothetical protein ACRC1K_22495 [Planctomycetia bacterium]